MSDQVQLSKRLTWLLRHGALQEGIPISSDGFVPVNAIIYHPKYAQDFNLKKLRNIVKKDKKHIYTMRKIGFWEIRANKGHTMANVVGSNCFQSSDSGGVNVHDIYCNHFDQILLEDLRAIEISRFAMYNEQRKYNQGNKSTKTSSESVPINSNDKDVPTIKTPFKCTVCFQKFSNSQECLKHFLLHDIKSTNRPHRALRIKVNDILANIKADDQQSLQKELLNALHKSEAGQELCTIFKYHRINDEDLDSVYKRVEACLYKELQPITDFKIHLFGSIASGLALQGSDIDLYIEHVNATRGNCIELIFDRINIILKLSSCFSEVIPIRQARVPIIKCKHNPTGFSLDINLSCPSSVRNTKFVRDLVQFDNRIRELITFLKIWAKQQQLIGRGYMTSYCLITLVLFYLQQPQTNQPAVLPSIKELQDNVPDNLILGVNYAYQLQEKISPLPRELTTSKLIEDFCKFYRFFDFENFLICPYLGEAIPLDEFKKDHNSFPAYNDRLCAIATGSNGSKQRFQVDRWVCVQDPFDLNHNVAKSITQLELKYFGKCLNLACDVYEDVNVSTDAQRYEALLYDIIERMNQEVI